MSAKSHIEWTEASWNPVTGCTKISEGCEHCYAERMAMRLKAMGNSNYRNGFTVTTHESSLSIPAQWKHPRMIFVNSMSDLFHEDIPESFIHQVFHVMNNVDRHIYQILTKRSERLLELAPSLHWSKNIWAGVTIESSDYLHRLDHLRSVSTAVRFVSFEPLLGQIDYFSFEGINWVIVGGESGPGARPMKEEWVTGIKEKCIAEGVPFFFKQWGGVNKKKAGRILEGREWDQMPRLDLGITYA